MILSYKFSYNSQNHILSYFLDFYAKKYSITYEICENLNTTTLFVEGEEADILAFNDESMPKIPHFLFLKDFNVEICDTFTKGHFEKSKTYPNITPKVAEIYSQSAQISPNEFGILSQICVFMQNDFIKIDENNFFDCLDFCLNLLKNSGKFVFRNEFGEFEMSNEINFKSDFLMPTNLSKISTIFVANQKAQFALASFEKPVLNLRLNALYRQNHPKSPVNFWLKGAQDLFIYALLDEIYKQNINFVSVKCVQNFRALFKIFMLDNDFTVLSSTYYLNEKMQNLLSQNGDKKLLLYATKARIYGTLERKNLLINLSKNANDEILVLDDKTALNLLNLSIPQTFEEIANIIKSEQNGAKLFANFTKEFSFPSGKISGQNNFFTLFCIIEKILHFSNTIANNADICNIKKGLGIDFKIKNGALDLILIIKNAMSYKLACVDEKIISFGILQSLVLFLSELCEQAKSEFETFQTQIYGEMFECKALCELSKLYLGVKFSDEFPIML